MINRWLNVSSSVLRSMFGLRVNYVDWSDFIVNCLELSYPTIEDLLDLKNQYTALEKEKRNNPNQYFMEGTITTIRYYKNRLFFPSIHFIIFRNYR